MVTRQFTSYKILRSIHYRQFSIIIRSLDCSSTCGKSSHLPSLDTGSPPIHPPTDFSGTKTCRTSCVEIKEIDFSFPVVVAKNRCPTRTSSRPLL